VSEVIRCVLLCMLEAVEGTLCFVLEVMHRVLCIWRPWRVSFVCRRCWAWMRRMLLCMQEVVEGELCFVLEVIRCVLFCILEAADGAL